MAVLTIDVQHAYIIIYLHVLYFFKCYLNGNMEQKITKLLTAVHPGDASSLTVLKKSKIGCYAETK